MSKEEILFAPLGYLSPPVEKAIGYLKTVTCLNEIDNQEFNVQQMIESIGRINGRHAKRIIESQSVKKVKTWSPDKPTKLNIEPHATKEMICINPSLSLPHGGDWIEVCYLPEDAFSPDPVKKMLCSSKKWNCTHCWQN